jgi:integrase
MTHKRSGSPYWQVAPTLALPGRGRIRLPARSSRTTSRAAAKAMSRTLQELPAMGYADLVERYLSDPSLSPGEVHAAKLSGTLDRIRLRYADPALFPLLASTTLSDAPSAHALTLLPDLIRGVREARGERGEPRLSWLTDAANIQTVLEAKEAQGRKRNSVYRSERRAVSHFLTAHVGAGERARIMGEVRFPREDDTRMVFLRPGEIDALLYSTVDPMFRLFLTVALGSGIDRGPLLKVRPRHWEPPILQVQDTKTRSRFRVLELGPVASGALRKAILLSGAKPDGRVFGWTVGQVRHRMDVSVQRAGLDRIVLPDGTETKLRIKDLRGVFATYFLRAGGSARELQGILGHSRIETTLRYVKLLPIEEAAKLAAVEQRQGLALLGIERTA